MKISTLDIEASGLSLSSYPIEIGVYFFNGLSFVEKSWIIKPTDNWIQNQEWSERAFSIHKIKKDFIIENGIDIKIVCNELNHLLKNTTLFVDHSKNDHFWLNKLFKVAKIECLFNIEFIFDNHDISNQLSSIDYKDFENKKIEFKNLYKFNEHRALDDAKLNALLLNYFINLDNKK